MTTRALPAATGAPLACPDMPDLARLSRWITAFDRRADRWLDVGRGRPGCDATAAAASALGDHGRVWFALGLIRGRGRRRSATWWAVTYTGAVTPVVNHVVKAAVDRRRPAGGPDRALPVRIPTSASFPSGHALAAWSAATMLADGDRFGPAYYALAATISWSRVHLRLHHTSDVLAGSLLGVALGRLGVALGRSRRRGRE